MYGEYIHEPTSSRCRTQDGRREIRTQLLRLGITELAEPQDRRIDATPSRGGRDGAWDGAGGR
jgi:hypothetical protein